MKNNKSSKKSVGQKPIGLIVGAIIVIVLGGYLLWENFSERAEINEQIERQNGPEMVLFWNRNCAFCHDLMQGGIFRQAERDFNIVLRENYMSGEVQIELNQALMSCGISPEIGGVPLLYVDGDTCIMGSTDIEAFLSHLLQGGIVTTDDFINENEIIEDDNLELEASIEATESATNDSEND
ncbi:MAG: hypothetical protein LBG64_02815 [Pseudomonadales bacterium]|jgi:hypothetical protein|nr:hypothetical protein [Pseudomonadales bacterium]